MKGVLWIIRSLLIATIFLLIWSNLNPSVFVPKTKFILYEETCKKIFACSPQEFTKDPQQLYDDFCVSAKVTLNGDLELKMTKQQVQNWREYLESVVVDALCQHVVISQDYTKITIYAYDETLYAHELQVARAYYACYALQFLNGIDQEDINIKNIRIDAGTNEIKFQWDFPKEGTIYKYKSGMFSSQPDNAAPCTKVIGFH